MNVVVTNYVCSNGRKFQESEGKEDVQMEEEPNPEEKAEDTALLSLTALGQPTEETLQIIGVQKLDLTSSSHGYALHD